MNEIEYDKWRLNICVEDKVIINSYNKKTLSENFAKNLNFGTAGIRAKLGLGNSVLNYITIRRIAQGYANYLKNLNILNPEIVIGYDTRNKSELFAKITAQVMKDNNIKAYISKDVIPTPIVSYCILQYQASGGVMITASHNPSNYNGYKIYNKYGSQLNLEEANLVQEQINLVQEQFSKLNFEKMNYIDLKIINKYKNDVVKLSLNNTNKKEINVTFSPINGASYKIIPEVLELANYNNINVVKKQCLPDPNFAQAKSLNPEEIAAYEYALEVANKSDLIIVVDPDGDRLGVLVKTNDNYQALTGNELGALLIDYLANKLNIKTINNPIIYNSIVTGEFGNIVAKKYGIEVVSTLTGFKFIGEKIATLKNNTLIMAYEESYGYLFNPMVRDKDATQATLMTIDMANYYKNKDKTLIDKLVELQEEHGYFIEKTCAYNFTTIQEKNIIQEKMLKFEQIIKIGGYKITHEINYAIDETGLPKEEVIKKFIQDIGWIAIRPSGTEPKIKVYISIKDKNEQRALKNYQMIKKEIDIIMQ